MRKTALFAVLLIVLATIAIRGVERQKEAILRAAAASLLIPLVEAQRSAVLTQSSFRDEESAGSKRAATCKKDRAKRG